MRTLFIILSFFILSSCDNGDFEVPSFEFDNTVNTCGSYIIYRTNSDKTEAFIIRLTSQDIKPEETVTPIEVAINPDNVQYRIFDDTVNTDYFCADVPPVSPIVTRNWTAASGSTNKMLIETTAELNTDNEITGYKHTINLKNLILESNGETQTYETYYFGSFITHL